MNMTSHSCQWTWPATAVSEHDQPQLSMNMALCSCKWRQEVPKQDTNSRTTVPWVIHAYLATDEAEYSKRKKAGDYDKDSRRITYNWKWNSSKIMGAKTRRLRRNITKKTGDVKLSLMKMKMKATRRLIINRLKIQAASSHLTDIILLSVREVMLSEEEDVDEVDEEAWSEEGHDEGEALRLSHPLSHPLDSSAQLRCWRTLCGILQQSRQGHVNLSGKKLTHKKSSWPLYFRQCVSMRSTAKSAGQCGSFYSDCLEACESLCDFPSSEKRSYF